MPVGGAALAGPGYPSARVSLYPSRHLVARGDPSKNVARGPKMTQRQNKSVEFYVQYLPNGELCMCDKDCKETKKQRFAIFKMLGVETILGSI